jgi:hypothetical protein
MRATAAVALLVLAGCPAPPADGALKCGGKAAHRCPDGYGCVEGRCWAAGHEFDMAVELPPEDMAGADLGAGADLSDAAPPHELGTVTHFYPTLEQEVEGHGCVGCHSAGNPPPRLLGSDTALQQVNFQALKQYTASIIAKVQQAAHCSTSCIPPGEIDAWQQWVTDPQP